MPFQTMFYFLKRHLVRRGSSFLGIETAEFTEFVADIRIVDMLVAHKVGLASVQPFANDIGKVSNAREIGRRIQEDPIFTVQPLPSLNFFKDQKEFVSNDLPRI